MTLLDSCVWIEWFADGPLADTYGRRFDDLAGLLVPAMVILEVHKWTARARGDDAANLVAGQMLRGVVAPMTAPVALLASDLARKHGLATADAIILAHARLAGVELVTCDRHFEGLEGVVFTPKAPLASGD